MSVYREALRPVPVRIEIGDAPACLPLAVSRRLPVSGRRETVLDAGGCFFVDFHVVKGDTVGVENAFYLNSVVGIFRLSHIRKERCQM